MSTSPACRTHTPEPEPRALARRAPRRRRPTGRAASPAVRTVAASPVGRARPRWPTARLDEVPRSSAPVSARTPTVDQRARGAGERRRERPSASGGRPGRRRGAATGGNEPGQFGRMDPDAIERVGRRARAAASLLVGALVEGLVVVIAGPHRRASVTTARPDPPRHEPPRLGRVARASAGRAGGPFRRLTAVLPPSSDARDWIALTHEPLPARRGARVGDDARGRARSSRSRASCATHAEGRDGVTRHDVRGLRGACDPRDARDRRPSCGGAGPTSSASRCCIASASSQLSEASVVVVVSAPHRARRVRRGSVRDRHAEGERADLEAGALVGRLRLGGRAAPDPSGGSRPSGSRSRRGLLVVRSRRQRGRDHRSCCCATAARRRWSTASTSSSAAGARSLPNTPAPTTDRRRRSE